MSDPLSIAGSIAGLAQLAGTSFVMVSKYAKTARAARQKITELAVELRTVSGTLHHLSLLVDELNDFKTAKSHIQAPFLDACRDTIKKIELTVGPAQRDFGSGRKRDALKQSLAFPLSEGNIEHLLADMTRHREMLNLALNADSMETLLKIGREQKSLQDSVQKLQDTVNDRFEIETRVRMDDNRRKVLDYFTKVDPQPSFETSVKLRHASTGQWLTENDRRFLDWKSTMNSKLWLQGIGGAGKTVLCGAVIQQALGQSSEDCAIAYHFCDYKNNATHLPENILAVVATQLARQKDTCFDILKARFDQLHDTHGILKGGQDSFDMASDIKQMLSHFGKAFLVVDGLDECGDHCDTVASYLNDLAQDCPNLSIAVFSRDDGVIRDELVDFTEIKIAAQTEDLELYIATEMTKRKELMLETEPETRRLIQETLLKKANGMFRWVACQLDSLCYELSDQDRLDALDHFPETLNKTYDRILQRVKDQSRSERVRESLRKALLWICAHGQSLSINQLCEAISYRPDRRPGEKSSNISEATITRRLSSLIRKSADGRYFELAHFTVQEYLQTLDSDMPLGFFRYDEEISSQLLAETSLRFISDAHFDAEWSSKGDNFNAYNHLEEIDEVHPFHRFAARFWTRSGYFNSRNMDIAKVLFHPRKSVAFCTWLIQYMEILFQFDRTPFIRSLARPDFTTLHVAAAIAWSDLCNWLCKVHGLDADQYSPVGAPLHFALCGIEIMSYHEDYAWSSSPVPYVDDELTNRGDAKTIARTIEILLDAGAGTMRHSCIESFGQAALRVCAAKRSAAPLAPLLERGKGLDADMAEELRSQLQDHVGYEQDHLNEECYRCEISQMIHDMARSHPLVPEYSSLLSVLEAYQFHGHWVHPNNPGIRTSKLLDEDFQNAVQVAVERDQRWNLEELMTDARFEGYMESRGSTIVHDAVFCSSKAVLTLLLEKGFDPSRKNEHGDTPMHICKDYQVDTLSILFNFGLKPQVQNSRGENVWHCLAGGRGKATLEYLSEVDPGMLESLRTTSKSGRTPLADAILNKNVAGAHLICDLCPPDPRYFVSDLPILHYAARLGSYSLYMVLVRKGVQLDTVGHDGTNPLHHISLQWDDKLVKYLIENFDVSQRSASGLTPLETLLPSLWTDRVFRHFGDALFRNLFCPEHIKPSKGAFHIWDFFCDKIITRYPDAPYIYLCDWENALHSVAKWLKDEGLEANYVDFTGQPAITPLVKAFLRLGKSHYKLNWIPKLLDEFLATLSSATCAQSNRDLLMLLERSEETGNETLTHMLLSQDLDIYALKPADSIVEKLCHTASLNTFKRLIHIDSHPMNASHLNLFNEYMLISLLKSNTSRSYDIIDHLIQEKVIHPSGFTKNQLPLGEPFTIAASCYDRWDIVELLIKHGADIFATGAGEVDIAAIAAFQGDVSVLSMLQGKQYNWKYRQVWRYSLSAQHPTNTYGGCSLLHIAAMGGSLNVVQFLHDNSLLDDIECRSDEGATPLHFASWSRNPHLIHYLVECGASLAAEDSWGRKPLDYALAVPNFQNAESLLSLAAGDNVSPRAAAKPPLVSSKMTRGAKQSISRVDTKFLLRRAIQQGDTRQLKILCEWRASLVNHHIFADCDCSPLMEAARSNKPDVILWLLNNGAIPQRVGCTSAHTPCQSVVSIVAANETLSAKCLKPMLASALRHGISWLEDPINAIYTSLNAGNMNAFNIMIKYIKTHATELESLLREPSPGTQLRDDENRVAIAAILSRPNQDFYDPTIQARFNSLKDQGDTLLHLAAEFDNIRAAKILLDLGVSPNLRDEDEDGDLPLSHCFSRGMATCLLDHGALLEAHRDSSLSTAVRNSVRKGFLDVLDVLVSRGARLDGYVSDGNLLHWISDRPDVFAYLIQKGVDPFELDSEGRTSVEVAAVKPGTKIMTYLLHLDAFVCGGTFSSGLISELVNAHGTEPDSRSLLTMNLRRLCRRFPRPLALDLLNSTPRNDVSPLCAAVEINCLQTLKALLHLGADMELLGSKAGTALSYACVLGRLELVKHLVRRGARVDYLDDKGCRKSAFEAARLHPRVIRWLLVDRYVDQPKLTNGSHHEGMQLKPWSGKRRAGLRLTSAERSSWGETPFEKLRRLNKLRECLLGKAIRVEAVEEDE